jgi:hypothetical protein
MRIVTYGLLMAVFRIFTKIFLYQTLCECSHITFHLRGTVPMYKTVLEAVMEFVKLWQLSTIYKEFQLFGGVMLHFCVSGSSHFKGWWMGHVPLKCLEAPNDISLARKTEVFDYISVMAWKFKPYVNFQVFGVVDCQLCLLGCDLLFCRWTDGPSLWSSGQSFWLQIQRSRVRFLALPDFLSSSGYGTVTAQPREPREDNRGATWIKRSSGSRSRKQRFNGRGDPLHWPRDTPLSVKV